MTAHRDIERIQAAAPNSPDAVDTAEELVSAEIAALRQTVAKLTELNEQQAAQLAELAGPAEFLALLACDRAGYSAEALRKWCVGGQVEARQEGTRWFVCTRSLRGHLAKLGLAKAIWRP
jgi:hypothetical protein